MKNRVGKEIPDLFFCIAMRSEETAGGGFCRYQSMQEKLPMADLLTSFGKTEDGRDYYPNKVP